MSKIRAFRFYSVIIIQLVFVLNSNGQSTSNVEVKDSILNELEKAIDANNKVLECQYTYNLASIFRFRGETDSAIVYAQKAAELAAEIGDSTRQINSLNILAFNLKQKGEMHLSIEKYNSAIQIAKLYNDTILLANSLENLGSVYGSTGITDFPRALELLLESVKLKEQKQAWEMLPGTYKNISTIFREIGDTINREIYLLKAVDLIDRDVLTNVSFKAAVYNEAGRFYTDEKPDYEKAANYFNNVLEISRTLGWKRGIAVSLTNQANVKELQGEFGPALDLYNQALKLKLEMNDAYGLVKTYNSIGIILKKQKKYTSSIQNLEKAGTLAAENNMTNELKDNYYNLYEIYRETNNYHKSLNNFEKYNELTDSLMGESHKKTIAELKTKYETEQKELLIENLTNEKKVETLKTEQRTLIAIMLGALLVVIALLAFFIIRQNRLKNERSESELNQKLLRAQMNPHFIFNALGTIQNYIYNHNTNDAGKYLAKFAKLMRNILENSVNEQIPVEQEIEFVNNCLLLQQMRDTNHFEYEVITEGVEPGDSIPPMLAQPFIENAIEHAFKEGTTNGKILVKYIFTDDNFTVIIEDNGIGILATANDNKKGHKSYAIQLTKQRLALFQKNRRKSNLIEIIDLSTENGNGTRVVIHFKRA